MDSSLPSWHEWIWGQRWNMMSTCQMWLYLFSPLVDAIARFDGWRLKWVFAKIGGNLCCAKNSTDFVMPCFRSRFSLLADHCPLITLAKYLYARAKVRVLCACLHPHIKQLSVVRYRYGSPPSCPWASCYIDNLINTERPLNVNGFYNYGYGVSERMNILWEEGGYLGHARKCRTNTKHKLCAFSQRAKKTMRSRPRICDVRCAPRIYLVRVRAF